MLLLLTFGCGDDDRAAADAAAETGEDAPDANGAGDAAQDAAQDIALADDANAADAGEDAAPDAVIVDMADGSTDAPVDAATDADANVTDAAPDNSAPDASVGCTLGVETDIGQLCVREASDGVATFQVTPAGCLSSSCTIRHTTTCGVRSVEGNVIDLDALFCLEGTGDLICTSDCNGGGFADCSTEELSDGFYIARLGELQVEFEMGAEFARACDGSTGF